MPPNEGRHRPRAVTLAVTAIMCLAMLAASVPSASAIDEIKPYVVRFSPADGASDVPISTPITVDFSENVRSDNLPSYITLKNNKGFIMPKRLEYDNRSYRATIIPIEPLKYETLYIVIVSQLIQDLAGNSLDRAVQWTFNTTHEKIPPTVSSSVPEPGAEDVTINSTVQVSFSEPMDLASLSMEVRDSRSTPVIGNMSKAEDGLSMTFRPMFALAYGETYTVTVPRTVKDLAGNNMVADHVFTFTAQLEKIRPRVIKLEPIEGSVLIPRDQSVTVGFSEPMNATTLAISVRITNPAGDTIPATPYYDQPNFVLTVRPDMAMQYQTLYTVTVLMVAEDLAGNFLDREYVTTFTTVPIPQQSPVLNSWSPPDDEFNWYEGQAAPFSIIAADPNGDILVYTWTVNGEVKEDETFENFVFYPEPGSEGRYKVEVSISDGLTTPAKHFWIVNVIAPEDGGGGGGGREKIFTGPVITLLVLVIIVSALVFYYYMYLMDRKREILARTRLRLRPLKLARDVGPKAPPTYEELYLRPDGVYNRPSPAFKAIGAPKSLSTVSGVGRMATIDTGPVIGQGPKLLDAKEVEIRKAEVGPLMTRSDIGKRATAAVRTCPKCGAKVIEAAHGRLWCDQHGWV